MFPFTCSEKKVGKNFRKEKNSTENAWNTLTMYDGKYQAGDGVIIII